ncbi:NUDIX hydrolase [Actinokineospora sp. HUAS TT18]|uniref:NUDIX hydrolase n=1 Tax=Actinokineospora sp. HUAS TT18 TaxID=3447451 RepID=UPI003F526635
MARRDYLNDPDAPRANSIAVAVSAFIQDEDGSILLIRRTDNDLYSIPGGQVEPGETLTQAAIRECVEETGMRVQVTNLVGIYSNPQHVIQYDDGEIRQEFSICFRATPLGGVERTSEESREVRWVAPEGLPRLPIHPSTMLRIEHALSGRPNPFYT